MTLILQLKKLLLNIRVYIGIVTKHIVPIILLISSFPP